MNHVSLIGHLTKDPKLVDSQERPICEMRVAVDNGRYQTTFVDVRTFGEQAYTCAEYLHKGRRVGVAGKLAYSEWRTEDGEKRSRYSVIGNVDFLDRSRGEAVPTTEPLPEDPFAEDAEELPELPVGGQLVAA